LWKKLVDFLLALRAGGADRRLRAYTVREFSEREAASNATKKKSVLALVGTRGAYKWALLRCPCGCGEQIALNLMKAYQPVWEIQIAEPRLVSISPSVHATKCGAHFWLRENTVIWCP
jgi:hypothetical protein